MWNIAAMICFLKYFKIIFPALFKIFPLALICSNLTMICLERGVCVCLCRCVCVCVCVYLCMFILFGVVGASFVYGYAYDLCMHPQ